MPPERAAAHTGIFDPGNPASSGDRVRSLFSGKGEEPSSPFPPDSIRAVLVPHGDPDQSGEVAASAYRLLGRRSRPPDRVILLGPLHSHTGYGIILPTASSFGIGTGSLPVDRKTIRELAFIPETVFSGEALADEHSLETQLPFLSGIWGKIPIVPMGCSDVSTDVLARILDRFLADPGTLLVLTSDFSHSLSYDQARKVDEESFANILRGRPVEEMRACCALGINALLRTATARGLSFHLLDSRNSGDMTGKLDQVTGYGAFALVDEPIPS